jgi:hypothetical protein
MAIAALPQTLGAIVAGVGQARRSLILASAENLRRPLVGGPAFCLLRSARVSVLAYLSVAEQKLKFLFIREPRTEDLILRLEASFDLSPETKASAAERVLRLYALLPPFFGLDIPESQKAILAQALGENNFGKILFLRMGLFRMAAVNLELAPPHAGMRDPVRVAWMWHASRTAQLAYPSKTSPGGRPLEYQPEPFLWLLGEVANWAKSGYASRTLWSMKAPAAGAKTAVQRILWAVVQGWLETRASAAQARDARVEPLLPRLSVRAYRAAVTLRLRADGTLAEKHKDEMFRMQLTANGEEDDSGAKMTVSLHPPDFLVSGELRDKLLEAMLGDLPVRRIFLDTGLPASERTRFERFLRDAKPGALAARVAKNGEEDTDLFVFRGSWDGADRWVLAAATVRIVRDGTDPHVIILDKEDSMKLIYTDLPSPKIPRPDPLLPRYLFHLLSQLRNWQRTLE